MVKQTTKRSGWSLVGAVGAGLLASACCTLPLVFVMLGVGGAWLSTFRALEPLQPVFILLAASLLLFAYRRITTHSGPEVCEPGSICADPRTTRQNKVILWIAVAVTSMLVISPMLIGLLANQG